MMGDPIVAQGMDVHAPAGAGYPVSDRCGRAGGLEHDQEKACPGLDPGWTPVFRKDHAPPKIWSAMTVQLEAIAL